MIVQLKTMALALLLGVICLGSSSHADQLLTLSSGGTVSDAFIGAVGETLSIDFFLTETEPDTIVADEGLIGFGFDLEFTPGLGTISSANPDEFFDAANFDERSSTGFEWEYFRDDSMGSTGSSVRLGGMDFLVSAEGTTTFTLSDRVVGTGFNNASWFTPTLSFIDNDIFGSAGTDTFSFSVSTAVPEPGSMVFLPGIALLAFRRNRKRIV